MSRRIPLWRYLQRLLPAAGLALVVTGAIQWAAERYVVLWQPPSDELLTIVVGALLVVLVVGAGPLVSIIRRWTRRRAIVFGDVFIATAVIAAALQVEGENVPTDWDTFLRATVAGLSALLLLRLVMTPIRGTGHTPRATSSVLEMMFAEGGLTPLQDFRFDKLERVQLVDALETLVMSKLPEAFTFGLAGPWGSGKTSVLDELSKRLHKQGVLVVRFDAWSFREPDRVVESYFAHLERAIRRWTFLPGLRSAMVRLTRGLSAATHDRLGRFAEMLGPASASESVAEVRNDLSLALRALDRTVVVMVDDLDRLNETELAAALRAIRLTSELSVVHVIAYDRFELSRVLFPEEASEQRGRGFLGKIINLELTLSPAPRQRQTELLDHEMRGLWAAIGEEEARRIGESLRGTLLTAILRSLRTPRDVKRVVAATAWMWDRLRPHVNVRDLLLLSILQYCYPKVYNALAEQPELFVNLKWGDDLELHLRDEEVARDSRSFFDSIEGPPGDVAAIRSILMAMFPANRSFRKHGSSVEAIEAQRSRSIEHPEVFWRYFQLGLRKGEVPEAAIEDAVAEMKATSPGEKRRAVVRRLLLGDHSESYKREVVDRWGLAQSQIAAAGDPEMYADVVVAIAEVIHEIPGSAEEFFSPDKSLAFHAMTLIGLMGTQAEADRLALLAANSTRDLEFHGSLVFYSLDAEAHRREGAFGQIVPAGKPLRDALDKRLSERFATGDCLLGSEERGALVAVVYRSTPRSMDHHIAACVGRDPRLILPILRLAVVVVQDPISADRFEIHRQDLSDLDRHVDVRRLYSLVENADHKSWAPSDRAMCDVVREWVGKRHGGGQGASTPAS